MEFLIKRDVRTHYLWLVSLFLLPFFQGGYFHFEVFAFGCVQLVILILLKKPHQIVYKEMNSMKKLIFLLILLIITGAFLASFGAVDLGTHFIGILRLLVLVIFSLNLLSFESTLSTESSLVGTIALSGALMSILTIIVIVFFPESSQIGAYFIQNGRIGGFFQYANTYGIYMLICIMFLSQRKMDPRIIWFLTIFMTATILLTQSRGSLILGFIVIIWLFIHKDRRYILTGMVGGIVLGQYILYTTKAVIDPTRAIGMGEHQSEWLSRLLYYEDGIRMLVKQVLGYGYGGYYQVQSYYQTGADYHVRFIHNSLLQIGLDYGIIAMVAFLIILILPIVFVVKHLRSHHRWVLTEKESLDSWWVVAFYIMTIHSMIDFDFQFFSYLLLYVLVGIQTYRWLFSLTGVRIYNGENKGHNTRLRLQNTRVWSLVKGIGHTILLTSFVFFFMVTYLQYNGHNMESYRMFPYYTKNVTTLLKQEPLSWEMAKVAKSEVDRNPYYTRGFAFLRDYHYNNGDFTQAVFYGKKAVEAAPLDMKQLEAYLTVAYSDLLVRYRQGVPLSKLAEIQDITNTEHYLKQLESVKKNNYTIKHQVDFKMTDYMEDIVNRTVKLLNGDKR